MIGPVNGVLGSAPALHWLDTLTTQHLTTQPEDGMTTRRDTFTVGARILIGLIVLCGVALGVARDSEAAPLESWDDQINNATRFKVLPEFSNEAVLDKETQLVWQRDLGIVYGSTVLRTSWETSNVRASIPTSAAGRAGGCRARRSWRASPI